MKTIKKYGDLLPKEHLVKDLPKSERRIARANDPVTLGETLIMILVVMAIMAMVSSLFT